ncbi:MAG: hypothetical protein QW279_08160 [Candidatus Jordarchaeaceae archaeon]
MSTESMINNSRRIDKASASFTEKSEASSRGESSDTINVKLIEHMAKFREEVVRGITLKFPIKGLETVAREVFDNTLEKNFDNLINALNVTSKNSPIAGVASKKAHPQEINQPSSNSLHNPSNIRGTPKIETSGNMLNVKKNTHNTSVLEKTEKSIEKNEDPQKRIEELMFAIKARDRKILDQKKEIEKLQESLELLKQQVNSPFITNPAQDLEEGIQTQKQMQSLMDFMKKITPILNRDPKYKIMFYLKRVGKSGIKKLSEELSIPPNEINTLLRELETMKIIRTEGDIAYLTDVH